MGCREYYFESSVVSVGSDVAVFLSVLPLDLLSILLCPAICLVLNSTEDSTAAEVAVSLAIIMVDRAPKIRFNGVLFHPGCLANSDIEVVLTRSLS
jgi:hypothetical protein